MATGLTLPGTTATDIKKEITIVDTNEPVDYASGIAPKSYTCGTCGAHGVKLWRDYNTFLEAQSLYCARCGHDRYPDDDIPPVSEWDQRTGRHQCLSIPGMTTDQIKFLVPAVPTKDNDTFWGYTSVPDDGCKWWDSLPL